MKQWFKVSIALVGITAVCCGGSGSSGNQNLDPSATLTIGSSGVSPKVVHVIRGAQVTFVNNDTREHEIASDPHPVHTDCPELNGPILAPGARFTATMANRSETCGFHDHENAFDQNLQGTVFVGS